MDYKDYYTILGVTRDADEQTIKSAFRRLARVHHPDVNADKVGATEKFKEINEAYTVLSDPDKRARYDLFSGRYQNYDSNYNPSASSAARPQAQPQQRRTTTRTLDEEDFERIMRGFARAYS
ncbi:MAG: DnaJ domain-containing protein, partial [Caldilineales bacterium]